MNLNFSLYILALLTKIAFIGKKLEASKWKQTPIYNYNMLLEIFSIDRAISACTETTREKVRR